MFECEWETFINEYGCEQRYVCKDLVSHLTGHMHYNSPFETDNSCGNCGGANCDRCREIYIVSKYEIPRMTEEGYREADIVKLRVFTDKSKAVEYYNSL